MPGTPTRPRVGVVLLAGSLALVWVTAFLGPSAASKQLAGAGALPPWSLDTRPHDGLVTGLLFGWVVLGVVGVLLLWRALAAGWAPSPRRLLAAALLATAAFAVVPPVTNDDVVSYAAYGRMVVLRYDPYTTSPAELGRTGDPVGQEVGRPWRDSPSVYGPVATAQQAAVMWVAGDSLRTGVALLSLLGALAYAGTLLLVDRLAGASDERRRRALLLFGLNPFVLVHLVAGAHVDALMLLLVAAALVVVRRRPLLAGALGAAAGCVKLTGALAGLALAWSERAAPRRLAALALGAGLVAAPAYLAAGGWTALTQARRASRFVSFATPWRPVTSGLEQLWDSTSVRRVITVAALLLVAWLARLLARALPAGDDAVRATAVLALAWVLGAAYVLPWYDAFAWLPLALLPASRWDRLLLAHTAYLSFAYLPGRNIALDPVLTSVMGHVRGTGGPVVLGVVLVAAVVLARRSSPTLAA